MLERLIIAGSGGQGALLIGKVLAFTAANRIGHVTFFPSYGAEVRGGTSNCQIVLSSDEIASPVSDEFDSMILMNQASVARFMDRGAKQCLVVLDSSMCERAAANAAVEVDALRVAEALGDPRVANFVILGAYLARKPVVPVAAIEKTIAEMMAAKGSRIADMNRRALHAGMEACLPGGK